MDKKECIKCLAVLKQNYFSSFAKMTDIDLQAMVNLWMMHFKDESYKEVITAINYIIASDTREFAPPIGVIRAKICEIKYPNNPSTSEAWDLVCKAIGQTNGFYKLPKNIQKAVGSPSVLFKWGQTDISVFNSSIMASFRKSYENIIEKEKEQLRLPSSIKKQVYSLNQKNNLMIENNYSELNTYSQEEIEKMMLED